jgi:RNA polymerase sigma factor (TIGR02999 family)
MDGRRFQDKRFSEVKAMSTNSSEISLLLDQYRDGQTEAFGKLMALVYDDLRRLAAWQLQTERPEHTLQPTALVHEAYLKLAAQNPVDWQNKAHFFALAAQVMRHILVDHARAKQRDKRGGGQVTVGLDEALELSRPSELGLVELDEALNTLTRQDARKSRIVELRYFGGLSIEETADLLGISPATVRREWTLAKAWLRCELSKDAKSEQARSGQQE